jgi:GT2 family glycosyltransferase
MQRAARYRNGHFRDGVCLSNSMTGASRRAPRVSIIVVNWNRWADTALCLQTLFRLDYPSFQVVVCDNGSNDDSVAMIRAWATGMLTAYVPAGHAARPYLLPARRPTTVVEIDAGPDATGTSHAPDADLVLIKSPANLGFSGGNNVGMRHVLQQGQSDFVWLVNNDTAVTPDALRTLVARVADDDTRVLASSRIVLMADPERIWFEGGAFNPMLASARHVSRPEFEHARHRFLSGCALLIGRAAWEAIGLLDDRTYFMYGEDVDYSIRARRAQVPLRVVGESVVLHAVGASSEVRSAAAYRHYVSGAIRVVMRNFSALRAVPVVLFHLGKLLLLGTVQRRPRATLVGYWQGIVQGFHRAAT